MDHSRVSASDLISGLLADARGGSVTSRTWSEPRERLLCSLEELASRVIHHERSVLEGMAASDRRTMQVENMVATMVGKCRKMGACLACTLNPCVCSHFRPLRLSHRLWVGKLLPPPVALRMMSCT